ncbi:MAG: hypothetical protein ACFE8A_13550 [Candidatus Hodarchaeota archaeon]
MTTEIKTINAEEVILYIDLTTEYIGKKGLIKEINTFIENKNKLGIDSSYGIVIFQEEDNPITLYDSKDVNSIIKIIEEKWETRPKNQSYIENGLFEILSYIFRKSREVKKIYQVIIFSDTPSKRSDEYQQAVYDLITKSKKFLTFIDIVRVGEAEYYEDDVKIKVITSETLGGTFHCNSNQFSDVLGSLVKSKQGFNIIKPEKEQVLEEDKFFYERLAVDLISLDPEDEINCSICQFELCPICKAYSDEIHKCYNCNAKFHNCCIAHYSISNNIGFKHIFRCPKCQNLLKLDEDYVDLIYEEDLEEKEILKIPEKEILEEEIEAGEDISAIIVEEEIEVGEDVNAEIVEKNIEAEGDISAEIVEEEIEVGEYLEPPPLENKQPIEEKHELEQPLEKKVMQTISELKIDLQELPPPPPIKKIKVGGFFGREIEIGSKLKKQPIKVLEPQYIEEKKSITELKPPKKRASFKFCKICGASAKDTVICPNCGASID